MILLVASLKSPLKHEWAELFVVCYAEKREFPRRIQRTTERMEAKKPTWKIRKPPDTLASSTAALRTSVGLKNRI